MSRHPFKKSDLNKGWMQKRADRHIRIAPEYHLIVSEGTKTEPKYFEAIKTQINKRYRNRINLDIHGEGDNTVSLFEKAKMLAKRSANTYKYVWVVYDTDDFPPQRINLTEELCRIHSTSETTFRAIWSNQCIELWFLLHFAYLGTPVSRDMYIAKLNKYLADNSLGVYHKGRPDMYAILQPRINTAIKNAKKLAEINLDKTPAQSDPGTQIHILIEKLYPYLFEII